MTDRPILYSFRRCPYAMRARLAVMSSGQPVELREVVLRDKPAEMLEISPKGTVPVLQLTEGDVLEESLDVMHWALGQNDPEGLLDYPENTLTEMRLLVAELDGPFKSALDRYKYENRYDGVVAKEQRDLAIPFLHKLDGMLSSRVYLYSDKISFADLACAPFVRQFAHVDRDWFWSQNWPNLIRWLDAFLASERFAKIMEKYPQWQNADSGIKFGGKV